MTQQKHSIPRQNSAPTRRVASLQTRRSAASMPPRAARRSCGCSSAYSAGIPEGAFKLIAGLITKIAIAIVVAVFLLVLATNLITVLSTRGNVQTVDELKPYHADAVVVLGASVLPDGTPSDILQDRLEVAVDLYKEGAAQTIIVSGDNRTSHYNESAAMKRYCVELGVPAEDIYEDHAGFSTYESMYRAKNVFKADSVIVATQGYHLYRAMFAAQGWGMDTRGVATDKGDYDNQNLYSLREIGARTKDFFSTIFHTEVASATSLDETDAPLKLDD